MEYNENDFREEDLELAELYFRDYTAGIKKLKKMQHSDSNDKLKALKVVQLCRIELEALKDKKKRIQAPTTQHSWDPNSVSIVPAAHTGLLDTDEQPVDISFILIRLSRRLRDETPENFQATVSGSNAQASLANYLSHKVIEAAGASHFPLHKHGGQFQRLYLHFSETIPDQSALLQKAENMWDVFQILVPDEQTLRNLIE